MPSADSQTKPFKRPGRLKRDESYASVRDEKPLYPCVDNLKDAKSEHTGTNTTDDESKSLSDCSFSCYPILSGNEAPDVPDKLKPKDVASGNPVRGSIEAVSIPLWPSG